MENLKWTPRVAQDMRTLTAWAYALGCGKAQVACGMLVLAGSTGLERSLHLPASFEEHLESELKHAEWLHQAFDQERARYAQEDLAYQQIEGRMVQAMESYVRSLLGYAERQTLCQEAQYCTATLALGSRIFRHSSELSRQCGDLELSQVLTKIVEEDVRHVRTAQVLLQSLPRETHGLYRSVRAFEEMLFGRMIKKLSRALDLFDCSALKRPRNPQPLARCV
jgi:hypothetical protein